MHWTLLYIFPCHGFFFSYYLCHCLIPAPARWCHWMCCVIGGWSRDSQNSRRRAALPWHKQSGAGLTHSQTLPIFAYWWSECSNTPFSDMQFSRERQLALVVKADEMHPDSSSECHWLPPGDYYDLCALSILKCFHKIGCGLPTVLPWHQRVFSMDASRFEESSVLTTETQYPRHSRCSCGKQSLLWAEGEALMIPLLNHYDESFSFCFYPRSDLFQLHI